MNNSAFLIDGHLEKLFIEHVCPNRPVQRINCNGRNVSMSAIASRISSQCRLFNNRYYPIIVVIDREDRTETVDTLSESLMAEIKYQGVNDSIIIAITDRMIENWILADREIVNKHPNSQKSVPIRCEGLHGKNIISNCLKDYHETTIGVELLIKCRASKIKLNSPSFAILCNKLPKNNCRWLSR